MRRASAWSTTTTSMEERKSWSRFLALLGRGLVLDSMVVVVVMLVVTYSAWSMMVRRPSGLARMTSEL
jgi:hypothetical protein